MKQINWLHVAIVSGIVLLASVVIAAAILAAMAAFGWLAAYALPALSGWLAEPGRVPVLAIGLAALLMLALSAPREESD